MSEYKNRLENVRKEMKAQGLDGFIVSRADKYQSKYPTDHDERLKRLTGFSGSAGFAVVLQDKAIAMTDPRYAITIKQEVDASLYEYGDYGEKNPVDWACENMKQGQVFGFDPYLHTVAEVKAMQAKCDAAGVKLVPVPQNPIDKDWHDQPAPPCEPAFIHDVKYAGRSSADKRASIAKKLNDGGVDRFVMSATDAICWLLNIRGGDTDFSPTVQGIVTIDAKSGEVDFFVDDSKLDSAVKAHLGNAVHLRPVADFEDALEDSIAGGERIGIDPAKTPFAYKDMITGQGGTLVEVINPAILEKACKNQVEQDNLRIAHRRDSLAWVKFLHWMDENLPAQSGKTITEMDASDQLDAFRREDPMFHQHGYGPISGWAENGANIHYHGLGRGEIITKDNMLLLDSGAQSKDGQTDITRAICVGTPSDEMIERYTLVLKGHISLARAVFPQGTTGAQVDMLARAALWERGLNYAHGTGHGVGFYLDVHEGPANIGPKATEPLREGMLLSNEPGYYKEGHYGIRLENEVLVQAWDKANAKGAELDMLCFETLSFVPFDKRLIDPSLFDAEELAWLNAYHAKTYDMLQADLSDEQRTWLKGATAPLQNPNLVKQPAATHFNFRKI